MDGWWTAWGQLEASPVKKAEADLREAVSLRANTEREREVRSTSRTRSQWWCSHAPLTHPSRAEALWLFMGLYQTWCKTWRKIRARNSEVSGVARITSSDAGTLAET